MSLKLSDAFKFGTRNVPLAAGGGGGSIPASLTVTGITSPTNSDPLVFVRGEDINGYPYWVYGEGEGTWEILWGGGDWGIINNSGANYFASFTSESPTPVGLMGWKIFAGAGEPTVSVT